jgi:hypothetical protein
VIICNRDANGRIVKWSVELGEFEIEFCPRQAIKLQILADFVSEWTEIQMPPPKERPKHWIMYFDGALNLEGTGAGVLLISPRENSSSTSYKSTTRPPTMVQSTKP